MNALLRRFVELLEADLSAAGFVRRGPVFRHFDAAGNGIVLEIRRSAPMWAQVEFGIEVGVVLAPHLKFYFGETDPSRDALPYHGVWEHHLAAIGSDPTFSLSTEADVDRAASNVRTWVAANLPRLKSWLGDYDAMLAAIKKDRDQSEQGDRRPDGTWQQHVVRAYAYADRGNVEAVKAMTANWGHDSPDPLALEVLAFAEQRLAEQRLAEQRLAEQRLAEQRLAEQRLAEQRLSEYRLSERQG